MLVLGACQKQEAEQSADKKVPLANTEPDESKRQFEADVEKSKQNAVSRFPELGVAGSEMNKAFVARVTHLRALNSPEFNYTNWPYQLACRVDSEVQSAKEVAEKKANQKGGCQKFTVPELLREKKVPFAEIMLVGMVTKVETGVGNKLSGVIYVDRKIRCGFELSSAVYGDFRGELVTRGDSLLFVTRDPRTSRITTETALFRLGQHVEMKGRIQQKADGSLAFKFIPPEIGVTNVVNTPL